jgi:hypothetical protein
VGVRKRRLGMPSPGALAVLGGRFGDSAPEILDQHLPALQALRAADFEVAARGHSRSLFHRAVLLELSASSLIVGDTEARCAAELGRVVNSDRH